MEQLKAGVRYEVRPSGNEESFVGRYEGPAFGWWTDADGPDQFLGHTFRVLEGPIVLASEENCTFVEE